MTRRYRPGDVVRCTSQTPDLRGREGLVLAVFRERDLPGGGRIRYSCDLLHVAYGEALVETDADSIALVRAADAQLALPVRSLFAAVAD